MGEKELAKSLLDLDARAAATAPDARELTRNVLRRDRRKVRVFAGLAFFCWLGSAVTLYWLIFSFLAVYSEVSARQGAEMEPMMAAVYRFLLMTASCLEGLMFAALFTILLVFTSRRATLRQVNANLIEIAQLLKRSDRSSAQSAGDG